MARAIVYDMDPVHPNVKRLKNVVDTLADGEVIIYPTDSVYGLGCDMRSKKGIDKLRTLKGVDDKHLMSFICADLSQAAQYVNIDNHAFSVLRRILPGPYTIILEANREVPKNVLGKRKTVGIRIPDSPVARFLVESLGSPIVSTSVDDDNGKAILDPEEISRRFGGVVSAIVDQGQLGDDHSTVLIYEEGEWEVVREGKGPVDFLD